MVSACRLRGTIWPFFSTATRLPSSASSRTRSATRGRADRQTYVAPLSEIETIDVPAFTELEITTPGGEFKRGRDAGAVERDRSTPSRDSAASLPLGPPVGARNSGRRRKTTGADGPASAFPASAAGPASA